MITNSGTADKATAMLNSSVAVPVAFESRPLGGRTHHAPAVADQQHRPERQGSSIALKTTA